MKRYSGRPFVPVPECRSTLAATLPAPPAAFALVLSGRCLASAGARCHSALESQWRLFLRRQSALVNGITAVLLIGITPPLPIKSIAYDPFP
jgi:hypothetical protein